MHGLFTASATAETAAATQCKPVGCWKIAAGRAVTLRPAAAGVCHRRHNRCAPGHAGHGPHARRARATRLDAGASLRLQAGQQVVIPAAVPPGRPTRRLAGCQHWRAGPRAGRPPWRNPHRTCVSALLAQDSPAAAGAVVRLAGGVLGPCRRVLEGAMDYLAHRDRLTLGSVAFKAQSGARRLQGCN